MPSSLIGSASAGGDHSVVNRSESNRSDKSDTSVHSSEGGSSKKVSFNKAVRVKKYSTPPHNPIDIHENKFWFKVYKTQYKPEPSDSLATHFDEPEEELTKERPLSTIVESGDSVSSTSTLGMHRNSSKKSHSNLEVTKSVATNSVHDNDVRHRYCSANSTASVSPKVSRSKMLAPKEPEIDYLSMNSPKAQSFETQKTSKRNPIVNGVKVMFGMSPSMPKKGKNTPNTPKLEHTQHTQPVREHQTNDSPDPNPIHIGPAQSKSKINLYSPPSRNANLPVNYKLNNIGKKSDYSDMSKNNKVIRYRASSGDRIKSESSYRTDKIAPKYENNGEMQLIVRPDSDDEQQPQQRNDKLRGVEVWESGPMLIADRTDYSKSLAEMPGEGKIFSTREEGSQIWKTKTRRKYVESVPKEGKENRRGRTDAKQITDQIPRNIKAIEYDDRKRNTSRKMITAATDDEKIVSANELDDILLDKKSIDRDSLEYVPMVRDVGIQCNRKRTNKHLLKATNNNNNNDTSIRVIKSSQNGMVSVYSDVPSLRNESPIPQTPVSKHEVWTDKNRPPFKNEVIYSQIDKTKKKYKNEYDTTVPNYSTIDYYTLQNQPKSLPDLSIKDLRELRELRELSPSRYPESSYTIDTENKTIKNKSKGYGFKFSTGIDGPDVDVPKTPTLKRSTIAKSPYKYDDDFSSFVSGRDVNGHKKQVTEEVIEETLSISNASSDDLMQHNQNTDIDEIIAPKSVIREIDKKKKVITYENVSPSQRQLTGRGIYDGLTTNGGGLWYRDIDEDYRRGMAQNDVSYPSGNEPSFSTLSRIDNKKKKEPDRDFSPPPRQAFTLDRKHLAERKKRMDVSGPRLLLNGKPIKEETDAKERFSKSDANLTRSVDYGDVYRGGLASAYKTRQGQRASSLNRVNAERSPAYPRTHLMPGHLGSTGNSAHSSSDSENAHRIKANQYIHDRDPIVMYIPAVSHHDKRASDESDRLSGILRSHSVSSNTKRPQKVKSKGTKITSASSDISPTKPRGIAHSYMKPSDREELDEIVELRDPKEYGKGHLEKKKGLSRRHSIPKDTKFPWFQRLKFKVKSKDS